MKKVLLSFLLFLFVGSSWAQMNSYGFASATGTYTAITGGTVLGSTADDDQRFVDPAIPAGGTATTGPGFPIGFNFSFDGVVFDRLAINSNGWISLGQSSLTPCVNIATSSAYTPIGSLTAITPALLVSRIAALGRDLAGQTGSELRIETVGASPNREFVIQWTGYRKYAATGDSYNFQIRLVETTNAIKFIYGVMTSNATSTTVQVGLRGAPATTATNYANRTTTTNWATTAAGSTTTAACTLSNSVYPASGLTYTYTVPALLNPSSFNATPVSPSQINLAFTPNGGNNVVIAWSLNNSSWTTPTAAPPAIGQPFAGGTLLYYGLTSPQPHTGLGANTPYYYMAFSYSGSVYSSGLPATATTFCGAAPTPFLENFNGSYPPVCWFEAYGNAPNPPAASSAWLQGNFGNVTANSLAVKMNVYGVDNDWLISPPIDLGTGNKVLSLQVAVTHWNTTAPETMVPTDTVFLLYSTSLYAPYAFNKTNAITYYTDTHSPPVTGITELYELTGLSGVVRFAFYGVGTGNVPDMDFHVDDFAVFTPSSIAGYVYDFDGNPVSGATVELIDGASTTSGIDGHYAISPLASGPHQFKCSKAGYNDAIETIDIPFSAEANYDFTLLQPQMAVEPGSLFAILGSAETSTSNVVITNSGNGALDWAASVIINTGLAPIPEYCAASHPACGHVNNEWIARVVLNTIDNSSACESYNDFTGMSTSLNIGDSYTIGLTIGNPDPQDLVRAWIDWNHNGQFDEAPIIFTGTPPNMTGNFTVPNDAVDGSTRIRIRLSWQLIPVPCGVQVGGWGEVEDYTITLSNWLKLDMSNGQIDPFGGQQTVVATFDASKTPPSLAPGETYTANIVFTSPSVIDPVTVPVTLVVSDGGLKGPQDLALYIVDEAAGKFMLKWKYFTLRDMEFENFVIMRNGEMYATSTVSSFTDIITEPGIYCYKVYAMYVNEVYSDPSNEVCLTYPIPPGVPLSNWALLLAGVLIGTYAFIMIRRRS